MSLLGDHYWLFTGRDWEQDRETMRCDFAICEHDHTSSDRPRVEMTRQEAKKRMWIAGAIILALFGFIVYAGHQLDKSLIEQEREVHLRLVHNPTPAPN